MTNTYVVVNSIEKETDKAILVCANGQVWLPKSQVEQHVVNGIIVIELPTWLWFQHKYTLSIRVREDQVKKKGNQND